MKTAKFLFWLCAAFPLAVPTGAQTTRSKPHAALPDVLVPGALGVNIHFTDARIGELEMLRDGGFRVARMDFAWGATEKVRGVYDFSTYDRLLKDLELRGIQPLFILDYGNDLYDEGLSPHTDAGRAAFARWAGAAASHFKGHKILWEMWNEPNGSFWKPKANVGDYIQLASATGRAIRQAAPGECYLGPGAAGMDFTFLEACFKGGLLELWDGVTVHPYRQSAPETVEGDYRRLRLLIERFKPGNKTVPILSGEWGYSSAWNDENDAKQGQFLPREWMINLMNGVPVSIWYDWHDDGTDPKEPEHHFGTTGNAYFEGRTPVYDPKPSYLAARTLSRVFADFRFNKRLALDSPGDYLLLFSKGDEQKLAAWTTGPAHEISVPSSAGAFKIVNYLGEEQPPITATASGIKLRINDSPLYLEPLRSNDVLQKAAGWTTVPLDYPVTAPATITLGTNAPKIQMRRDSLPTEIRVTTQVGAWKLTQVAQAVVTNPLHLVIEPAGAKAVTVRIQNPLGAPVSGQLSLQGAAAQAVNLELGDVEHTFTFPAPTRDATGSWTATARFSGPQKGDVLTSTLRSKPLPAFAALTGDNLSKTLVVHADGSPTVASEQSLSLNQTAPEPAPDGGPLLNLTYRFDEGWKFANIQSPTETFAPVEGQPERLGMWVYGDNSGNLLRMRFSDSTGQTFQPGGTVLDWKGWRYVRFPLDDGGGHWGGANDGQIHGAIKLESFLLLDSASQKSTRGAIFVCAPSWIYSK